MTDRIEAIRARHQAIAASEAVADQQTADVAYLLDLVGRQHRQFLELNKVIDDQQERIDDLNDEIADCEVLEYKAQVQRVKDLAKAWSDPAWSGYQTAAPFVRAINTALTPGEIEDRLRAALAPVAPDAEPEMLGGNPNVKHHDATVPTDGEQPGPAVDRKPRLRSCVERWPDCVTGGYHPACCRFPKSCSCDIYNAELAGPDDLESP